jgi:hypothetical protein
LTQPDALFSLLPPAAHAGWLVGNAFEAYGARLPVLPGNADVTVPDTDTTQPSHSTPRRLTCWPSAAALLRLAPAMLAEGRQPVLTVHNPFTCVMGQTTVERAAGSRRRPHSVDPSMTTAPTPSTERALFFDRMATADLALVAATEQRANPTP